MLGSGLAWLVPILLVCGLGAQALGAWALFDVWREHRRHQTWADKWTDWLKGEESGR